MLPVGPAGVCRNAVTRRSIVSFVLAQNFCRYFVTSTFSGRVPVVTEKSINFWYAAMSLAVRSLVITYLIIGTVSTTSAGVNVFFKRYWRASFGFLVMKSAALAQAAVKRLATSGLVLMNSEVSAQPPT